ncbi:hypothetical protein EL75_2100 [Escherichia coli]|nr:hypothetical protein EL75_2100 [Escherichia coli]KGM78762.1 hypothetical protein EL80_2413 [Escherichia coli]KGM81767.1 hypothetical protein EL79_2405 [Escherichia coli]
MSDFSEYGDAGRNPVACAAGFLFQWKVAWFAVL